MGCLRENTPDYRGASAAPPPGTNAVQNVCTAFVSRLSTALVPELLPTFQSYSNVKQNALPLVAAIVYAETRVLRIDILAVFCSIYIHMYLSSSSNCSIPTNASVVLYSVSLLFIQRTVEQLNCCIKRQALCIQRGYSATPLGRSSQCSHSSSPG